jgi:hypothetical protein
VENPGLSYGLFHALAEPVISWGVIRQVRFPGVNMDIGHLRTLGWSRANAAAEWAAYNRIRGQFMSTLEHAIPERFFNDSAECNLPGASSQNPALPACPQGISAVKAIAIAAAQGQRIYTITPQVYANNPAIVQSQLAAHSQSTKDRVQGYLDAGWEVSIHQSPITQDGWTGAGFTVIDPTSGAGGYLIEGGTSGGWRSIFIGALAGLVDALTQKLRNPNSANGPINEISRSYYINLLAKFATLAAFIQSVDDIVSDPSTNWAQKTAQIVFTLAFTVAAIEGAVALGVFFAPGAALVSGVLLGFILAFLLLDLNRAISEL